MRMCSRRLTKAMRKLGRVANVEVFVENLLQCSGMRERKKKQEKQATKNKRSNEKKTQQIIKVFRIVSHTHIYITYGKYRLSF